MAWPWIEEFAQAVENNAVELGSAEGRGQAANKICSILVEATALKAATNEQNEAIFQLLSDCRVFMRDRRGIDRLLTVETLDGFLQLSEREFWADSVRAEALKCMINSVYSRPEFVTDTLVSMKFASRLLELARHEGPATTHWLVWKVLLVACEAPDVPKFLCNSHEAWELLYSTLFYAFQGGDQSGIVVGDRSTLMIDMIKLISVLVNEMQWTGEQEKLQPEIFETIHQLGGLLVEILGFQHPHVSPLNTALVNLKNKAMEVFMFLPGPLLAAFILQQGGDDKSMLVPVINHLHSMLLVVRVEKTRPLKEMLQTLIVCHNLARTNDPRIVASFKDAILPSESSADKTNTTFYFKHLKFFLTCLNTDVRRYTAEWLFLLCDENAKVYTHHTGVGNAIGLLRTKGLA